MRVGSLATAIAQLESKDPEQGGDGAEHRIFVASQLQRASAEI